MAEHPKNLIDVLTKTYIPDDLKAVLPPLMTERLGKGEKGINRALALLIGLSAFSPEPTTFDRAAFDAVVAFDQETEKPLSADEAQTMFEVELEAGFIKKAPTEEKRFMTEPSLKKEIGRLFGE